MLPLDIYHRIAETSPAAYKALLALPPFARDIDVSKRYDYMILFGHSVVITNHAICWKRYGHWHRLDGPALESTGGTRGWYVNGLLHRLDGPAAVCPGGFLSWWVNDVRHRIDGPAVIYPNGLCEWWENGKFIKNSRV